MANITINAALVLQRVVRERLMELRQLRAQVSTKTSYLLGSGENRQIVEPQYNPKMIEVKISELEKFLLRSDSAIKTSNATTEISLDFDADKLLEPIQ